MNNHTSDAVILITGASSGIGLSLARKLWKTNYRVVITARESSLQRFQKESFIENDRFLIRALDVSSPEQQTALIQEIELRWGAVDVLINNAGISYRSAIEDMTENEELDQMRANYLGPVGLIRKVLPKMRERRNGKIINVSSVGGMMAMPTMGSYSASKWALEGASEALWYELRPWNINVSLVQPGFIHSDAFMHVRWSTRSCDANNHGGAYAACYRHMTCFIEKLMKKAFATSESVADQIIELIESPHPPLRKPATIDAYIFSIIRRFLPRRMYHWVLYKNLPGVAEWGTEHDKN